MCEKDETNARTHASDMHGLVYQKDSHAPPTAPVVRVCLSTCLPVCLSACLPVCLYACLPVYLYTVLYALLLLVELEGHVAIERRAKEQRATGGARSSAIRVWACFKTRF